jgi:exosortase/archaeosortase family protein
MIALFLGEYYRFDFSRRVIFVLVGSAFAFLFNVLRTFLLVRVAYREGIAALGKWHDPAGITILVVCFFGLWLLAIFLRRKKDSTAAPANVSSPPVGAHVLPRSLLIGVSVWFITAELFTQGWYWLHETQGEDVASWQVKWPIDDPGFKDLQITETVRAQLRFGEGRSGAWTGPDGSVWQMFYFTWPRPRSLLDRVIMHSALSHRPEICLPATGMSLQADLGTKGFPVDNLILPVRRLVFESRRQPVHVFHCVWEEGRGSFVPQDWLDWAVTNPWDATLIRLRAALAGRRHNGLRVLEVAVWGYPNEQEADVAFQRQLERLLGN